jgi:hypothetical protein
MPDSTRDTDLATILGIAFREVFVPIVGNDVSYHDFYSAVADTFRQHVTPTLLRNALLELPRLRRGFETYFECQGIEEEMLRTAIERTLRSAGE